MAPVERAPARPALGAICQPPAHESQAVVVNGSGPIKAASPSDTNFRGDCAAADARQAIGPPHNGLNPEGSPGRNAAASALLLVADDATPEQPPHPPPEAKRAAANGALALLSLSSSAGAALMSEVGALPASLPSSAVKCSAVKWALPKMPTKRARSPGDKTSGDAAITSHCKVDAAAAAVCAVDGGRAGSAGQASADGHGDSRGTGMAVGAVDAQRVAADGLSPLFSQSPALPTVLAARMTEAPAASLVFSRVIGRDLISFSFDKLGASVQRQQQRQRQQQQRQQQRPQRPPPPPRAPTHSTARRLPLRIFHRGASCEVPNMGRQADPPRPDASRYEATGRAAGGRSGDGGSGAATAHGWAPLSSLAHVEQLLALRSGEARASVAATGALAATRQQTIPDEFGATVLASLDLEATAIADGDGSRVAMTSPSAESLEGMCLPLATVASTRFVSSSKCGSSPPFSALSSTAGLDDGSSSCTASCAASRSASAASDAPTVRVGEWLAASE